MIKVMFALVFLFSSHLLADEVYTIQVERSYDKFSKSDLKKRVWQLERAVFQLQQKVFALEMKKDTGSTVAQPVVPAPSVDQWVCTMSAMGQTYTAIGASKAVATVNVTESCKSGQHGSTFHCKLEKCEK